MPDAPMTTPKHTDDMNDAVSAQIEADMAAGMCWACACEQGKPHRPYCPEQEARTDV